MTHNESFPNLHAAFIMFGRRDHAWCEQQYKIVEDAEDLDFVISSEKVHLFRLQSAFHRDTDHLNTWTNCKHLTFTDLYYYSRV